MPTGPMKELGWKETGLGHAWLACGPSEPCFSPRPRPLDQLSVSSPKVAKLSSAHAAWMLGLTSAGQSLWYVYKWDCVCCVTRPAALPSWPPEPGGHTVTTTRLVWS